MQEVLYAAAWLCGEFSRFALWHFERIVLDCRLFFFSELEDPDATLKCMIKYRSLPPHIEAVFIQNTLKLFAYILDRYETNEAFDEILDICELLKEKLNDGIKSGELEVQERASTTLIVLDIVKESIDQSKLPILYLFFDTHLFIKENKSRTRK